ncbi:putative ABC transport system permease protein [Candidatus Thermokryptus mobilis]|uniref:Putative ABC transport system permease protein n=1 Tax=Candidatus Thermokryptus mobilis TaxID=1643428 RepID=A0A0S4MNV3_9BACT|nr:ABC transporter permease [Candidatus Thermokryptus mobilis]CUU00727.1 putative ABC transport system permease protein [Candidatus Thermokryptus mobilis]
MRNHKLRIFWVELVESLYMVWDSIKANKLRTFLTLLGVVVGVFSIIVVMTGIRVLQNSMEETLSFLGTNTFQVTKRPSVIIGGADWAKYRNRKDITYEQALYVAKNATLPEAVAIEGWSGPKIVQFRDVKTNPNVFVYGETPEGFATNNWVVQDGRAIFEDDVEFSRFIVVLGANVTKKLFPNVDPIGKDVKIDGYTFKVVGVLKEKGGLFGSGFDNIVIIPLSTFLNLYGKNRNLTILVKAKSRELYNETVEEIVALLRKIRKVPPGQENDFEIESNETLIKQFNDLTFAVKVGALVVSMIALVAAGVGIMNIMLVSVTERTREIGIRKAVGATKRNILTQFLLESFLLSQFGGMIGIILGIVGGNVLAFILKVKPIIPYDWVVIGFLICAFVGMIFGVYPAWKAASVDPVESLRYE